MGLLVLFSGGCAPSGDSTVGRSHQGFERLSPQERLLAAKALSREPMNRSFPVEAWAGVYLREPDPQVAVELEHLVERAAGVPIVEWLVARAGRNTPEAELAAVKLLSDSREQLRLVGVQTLTRREGKVADERLWALLSDPGNAPRFRTVVASKMADAGKTGLLARWCQEAPGLGVDARLVDDVSRIMKRHEPAAAPENAAVPTR